VTDQSPVRQQADSDDSIVKEVVRWHPVVLPDDYIRKMRQDLKEVEDQVESKTRHEPNPDFSPPVDDGPPP